MKHVVPSRHGMQETGAGPDLVAALLGALCEESDALKSGQPARLASAASRKRHLLRLLSSGTVGASGARD